jgi:hypothetical protein
MSVHLLLSSLTQSIIADYFLTDRQGIAPTLIILQVGLGNAFETPTSIAQLSTFRAAPVTCKIQTEQSTDIELGPFREKRDEESILSTQNASIGRIH